MLNTSSCDATLSSTQADSFVDANHSTSFLPPISSADDNSTLRRNIQRLEESASLAQLVNRLDALLMVLKTCKGRQCTHPWELLFPTGNVKSLADARDPKFDSFFEESLEKVKFERCEKGYVAESEGPVWTSSQAYGMFDEVAID